MSTACCVDTCRMINQYLVQWGTANRDKSRQPTRALQDQLLSNSESGEPHYRQSS